MRISCAFAPVPDTPRHIAVAEELGFHTAWVYDTPALQLDVWMTLALAAVQTKRIVLGPGVLIPSLRHPMVTASAIAHLVSLLGEDRVVIGLGTGFTGRRAMGHKPLRWADIPEHVATVQRLLRGDTVEVEGRMAKMLHGDGQAPARPIDVRWVLGVNGPKGAAVARALGLGVFTTNPRSNPSALGVPSATMLAFGTVIPPGETGASSRVVETAGPGAAVAYHALLEQDAGRLDSLPNGARFVELINATPEATRHLVLHHGHLTALNDIDRHVVTSEAVVSFTPLTGTAEELTERVASFEAAGITEVAYQPMGDIEGELHAMADALAPWMGN